MEKWKSFFECTSAERRGLLVLSVLVILLLALRVMLVILPPKPLPPLDAEEYQRYLAFEERQQFLADSADAVWAERRQAAMARYNRPRPVSNGSDYRHRPTQHEGMAAFSMDSSHVFIKKYPEKRSLSAEKGGHVAAAHHPRNRGTDGTGNRRIQGASWRFCRHQPAA